VLGLVAIVATAGLILVGAASALSSAQRVSAAADAAALAAADVMLGWVAGEPCDLAARVARAHRTALHDCRSEGFSMVVTVRMTVLGIVVERSARAGPPGAAEVRTRAPCVWCG
jgi:secretion/DNA translocation related TadE-like protein